MALAFHREGNRLFVTVSSPDKNNTSIIEVDRALKDGTVQKNPIAYERYGREIEKFKAEKPAAGSARNAATSRGNLTAGNLTDADHANHGRQARDPNDAPHGNVTHRRGR